jgi:PAS domain S-box-containing protein
MAESKQLSQITESALHSYERQFRLMVEAVSDYAIFMLDPHGLVVSWNRGARRIKGYEAAEIIGRHFSCFYTASDQQLGLPMRALKVAAATGHFRHSGWRVRKDGSMFLADVVITAVKDETGSLIGFSKVTRDLTDSDAKQSRAEIDPKTLEAMRSTVRLVAEANHELRGPIQVIHLGLGFGEATRRARGRGSTGAQRNQAGRLSINLDHRPDARSFAHRRRSL